MSGPILQRVGHGVQRERRGKDQDRAVLLPREVREELPHERLRVGGRRDSSSSSRRTRDASRAGPLVEGGDAGQRLFPRGTRARRRRRWRRGSSSRRAPSAPPRPPSRRRRRSSSRPAAVASAIAFATAFVPASNGGVSNTPIGPFQTIVLAARIARGYDCAVSGPMSSIASVAGIASRFTACAFAPSLDRRRHGRVVRQREAERGALDQRLRHVHAIGLDERLARLQSHRLVERARHRAADQQAIDLREQLLDHVDLAGDLGAAEYRDERARRLLERAAEPLELALHQQAGDGGVQERGDAGRGRVRAVRGAERVVHVEVAQRARTTWRARVVLLLAGKEARVLEQQHVAVGERLRRGERGVGVGLGAERHRLAEQLGEPRRDRRERVLRLGLCLGAAEVREEHDARAALISARSVGIAARMRVSSVMRVPSSGTLKSTRTSARFP